MAVPAIADQVDDDVLLELHAEVECKLGNEQNGLGIITVNMEDRCVDHLGHVAAVEGRT